MARKPRETMRQRQMRLRRMQQAMKGSTKKLPPGKKGGSIVKSGSATPENPRRTKARFKSAASAKGKKGSSTRVAGGSGLPKTPKALPPKGGSASNLMKNLKAGKNIGGKGLGALGLIFSGAATAQDLVKSLKKGEGYARLPKHIAAALKGNKDKKPAKPVGQGSRNRKKPTATKAPTSKSSLSNIPAKEGTGKAAEKKYQYGAHAPKTKPTSTPKTNSTSKPKPKTAKERAYAADARNKEYDKLRKAGKIKEAEKLGKQIAADARKKAPKNPFRAPQGAERKDRLSKQVAELKTMGKKKEKEKQSKANKAGWPGNRNY